MSKRWIACVLWLASLSQASAGQWVFGGMSSAATPLTFPFGGQFDVQIASGDRDWYWLTANAVTFGSDASGMFWQDINGGDSKHVTMKFSANRPIESFTFVTPTHENHMVAVGNAIVWEYSLDGETWLPLWKYEGKGGEAVTVGPQESAVQKPKTPTETLWLRYTMKAGFAGVVRFGEKAGGMLKLNILEKPTITIRPIRPAQTFYTREAVRLTVGPIDNAATTRVTMTDATRARVVPVAPIDWLGRYGYLALPTDTPGVYDLDVRDAKGTSIVGYRWAVVAPPVPVTLAQISETPFGIYPRSSSAMTWDQMWDVMQTIGLHSCRGQHTEDWVTGELKPGEYSFLKKPITPVDYRMSQLIQVGARSYGGVCWTPQWAVDLSRVAPGVNFIHYPPKPEYVQNYYNFCKALATHWTGYVELFQTYNEPNCEPYGSWKGTIEEWAKLNRAGQDGLKAGNPKAKLLGPVAGDVDLLHIKRCWEIAGKDLFDVIDVHPYRHDGTSPENGNLLGEIRGLQELIAKHGNNQPIYFSEIGWTTFEPLGKADGCYISVSQVQQAWYLSRTFLISLAAGVKHIDWFIFGDYAYDPKEAEYNFGMVDYHGNPKPSLVAYSGVMRHLEQAACRGGYATNLPRHYAAVWSLKNRDARYYLNGIAEPVELLTVWYDESLPGQATKPVLGKRVKLPSKPLYVEDMYGAPANDRLTSSNGEYYAQAGEDPLFIYVAPVDGKLISEFAIPLNQVRRSLSVSSTPSSLTIDGLSNDWPADTKWQDVTSSTEASPPAKFGVANTAEGLAIYAHVATGKKPQNPRDGWYVWAGDHVRIFIDIDDAAETPMYTEKQFHLGLAPVTNDTGPAGIFNIANSNALLKSGQAITDARIASQADATGYSLEAVIPWTTFGTTRPAAGTTWGFDFQSDWICWNGAISENYYNPERFGRIVFK